MIDERNMSEKKRTTVTTIETHEVWFIRKVVPERSEVEVLIPDELATPPQVSPLRELNNSAETNHEDPKTQSGCGDRRSRQQIPKEKT
jgi:hypothetical protein